MERDLFMSGLLVMEGTNMIPVLLMVMSTAYTQ